MIIVYLITVPPTQKYTDILECEVKWALGSTTMNRTSGGDGIPTELVLHSI